jgi:hypothetical protein
MTLGPGLGWDCLASCLSGSTILGSGIWCREGEEEDGGDEREEEDEDE